MQIYESQSYNKEQCIIAFLNKSLSHIKMIIILFLTKKVYLYLVISPTYYTSIGRGNPVFGNLELEGTSKENIVFNSKAVI